MSFRRLLCLLPVVFLAACSTTSKMTSTGTLALQGRLHGGQQPVSGSSLQLYAVGLSGGGSPATPLLSTPGTSDGNGGFNITGAYSCPTAASQVYLLARGGNPGLAPGTNNAAITLMAALGPCGNLSSSTFINVDEVTTVALANVLAPFTYTPSAIGSSPSDAVLLNAAFTMANRFASTATGNSPGANIPSGDTVPVAEINTLANILAGCVNSAGGTAGDSSACGTLFSLATAPGVDPPTDTFTAAVHIADTPALNASALFNTSSAYAPFQPALASAPSDFSISLAYPVGLQSSVPTAAFGPSLVRTSTPAQTITLSNTSASAIALSSIAVTGAYSADFVQTNNCPISLAASASCAVQIIFTPSSGSRRVAALAVSNSSALSPLLIGLSGVGTYPTTAPTLTSASPASVIAGAADTLVTLNGIGFTSTTTVYVNNASQTTTYLSPESVSFVLRNYYEFTPATLSIYVRNEAGQSNAISLPIVNATPVLTAISPSSVIAGSPNFLLTLTGANFSSNPTVLINGISHSTFTSSGTSLSVSVNSTETTNPGSLAVTVISSVAGGGSSAPQQLQVLAAGNRVRTLNYSTSDLVTDPLRTMVYASVNAYSSLSPSSLVAIDPTQGTVVTTATLNGVPDRIAISDDGAYLYVSLPSTAEIARFKLPSLAPDVRWTIPSAAQDLKVAPGLPHTLAVSYGGTTQSSSTVSVYDDAVARPNHPTVPYAGSSFDTLAWGATASILYATDSRSAGDGGPEYILAVDSNGASLTGTNYPALGGFLRRLTFDKATNRLYDGYGNIVDPATGTAIGQFNINNTLSYEQNDIAVDAPGNRAFILNENYFSLTSSTQTQNLQAFDLGTFSFINALDIPGLSGSHLVRWGASGLAIGGGSQLFLVDGTFVSAAGPGTPVGGYAAVSPTITSIMPATAYAGDGPTTVTITGKDFTGAALATWQNQSLALTVQSTTQATLTFSAAQLATAASSPITLTNGPGTENSNGVPFTVLPNLGANTQISALSLSGQDMAYDPTRGLLYIAVTSSTAINGNSIVTVDPATAAITATQFTGFQPSTLGLSDDGKYLYAGFQSLAAVRRYALQDFSLNLTIPLTLGPTNQNFAGDIKVAPGQNQTIAVSFGSRLIEPRDGGGMAIYDDATPRAQTSHFTTGPDAYKLAWGGDATHLYAHSDPEFQGQSLSLFTVGSAGLNRTVAYGGYTNLALRPHYDAGTNLVYSDGGHIADPVTGAEAGSLSSSGFLATDSALNRAFVLRTAGSGYSLDTFDLRHQTLLKSVALPGISGYPTQLLRWGTQGLAILTDGPGMLYLLQGSDISGLPTPPAYSITLNPSAVVLGSPVNTLISVTGSNFGASSVVELGGTAQPTTVLSSTQLTFQLPASQAVFAHYLNVAVTNLANGAGTTPEAVLEIDNPIPAISGTGKGMLSVGATDATLILNGSGFLPASLVRFNGTPLATTYLSATSLSYVVPSADLATAGRFNLTVVNPAPGGGASVGVVLEVDNPTPTLTSVSPSSISTGSGPSIVFLLGTNFNKATTVTINGTAIPISYYSSTQLQVSVPASYFASSGSLSLRAINPAPGGSSAAVSLAVNSVTPSELALSPNTVNVGAKSAAITVTGLNFIPSSVVQISGQSRTTTYVSPTQLTFLLTSVDVATTGNLYVQVVNPVAGGSSTNFLVLTIAAANTGTPVISFVSPAQLPVNSPSTTLYIYASNLSGSSFAQWNGTALAGTSYPAYGYVSATVPASLLTSAGPASVTINTPGAAVAVSSPFTLSVVTPVAPTLTSISPANGPIGTAVTVTLTGTNFASTSVVSINGDVLPSTFVGSTQLTVAVPASELPLGNNLIAVMTPAPGGGISATVPYTTFLPQASNSMVYNPVNGLFYLSVPASAGAPYGNSVVSVDPISGALGQPIFVGSEPNRFALTADGHYLWVGLNGSNSVRKVDLVAGTAGLQFVLPNVFNPPVLATALALAAIPGQSDSVAVSIKNQSSPTYLGIFDSGVLRGSLSTGNSLLSGPLVLQVDGTRNEIYSAQGTYYEVWNYSSAGVTVKTSATSSSYLSDGSDQRIQVVNGKTYSDSGTVLNAESGTLAGNLATSSTVFSTAVDGALGRVFALAGPANYPSYPTQIQLFNTTDLSSASNSTIPVNLANNNYTTPTYVSTLTRWGANGLAFRSSSAFFALRSNLVQDLSGSIADLSLVFTTAGSSTTGTSTTYTATVSNAGPAAASEVRFTAVAPATGVVASITTPVGSCRSQAILACDLGPVGSGASTTVTIVVNQLTAGASTLTAQVSASQADPNLANNQATSTLQIAGTAFNLSPTLQSLNPSSVLSGSTDTVITANGLGFTATSVLQLDGTPLPTNYVSPTQLTAVVPAASLASLSWHGITIATPAPGGGLSTVLPLTVYSALKIGANRLAYEPFSRKFLATLGSSTPTGNSVEFITPDTATIGETISVGSEPTRLALTEDSQYLYVLLTGSSRIQRVNLLTQQREASFPVVDQSGTYGSAGVDFAVQTGSQNTLAVTGSPAYTTQIVDFDPVAQTASPRSGKFTAYSAISPRFLNPSSLFVESGNLVNFAVNASGLAPVNNSNSSNIPLASPFKLNGNLLFTGGGGVADVSILPARPLGIFPLATNTSNAEASVAPDPAIGSAFFLASYDGVSTYTPGLATPNGLVTFSTSTFLPTGFIPFAISAIDLPRQYDTSVDIFRWGQDGIAALTSAGTLYLARGPAILPQLLQPATAPVLGSATPTLQHGSTNAVVKVTGSNFQPGIAAAWNGDYRTTLYVDPTHIAVDIPATDLTSAGTATLTLTNPGSTTSMPANIPIN